MPRPYHTLSNCQVVQRKSKKKSKRIARKAPVASTKTKPIPKPKRPGRKRISREELERQFDMMLGELAAEKAIRRQAEEQARQAEAETKRLKQDVVRMFVRAEETPTERHARLAISFELETRYLMPRKGETMRGALENWASRNGWTSEELWTEYKRVRPAGFHKTILDKVMSRLKAA
jgi:hypothetical protein